jgi:hypothetical protein
MIDGTHYVKLPQKIVRPCDLEGSLDHVIATLADACAGYEHEQIFSEYDYDETYLTISGYREATQEEIDAETERLRLVAHKGEEHKSQKAAEKAAAKARLDLQALERARAAFPDKFIDLDPHPC